MDFKHKNPTIDKFQYEYRFLSNFYPCPILFEGVVYPSVENAYQAAKTTDTSLRVPFESVTSGKAKRLGSNLELRDDWNLIKVKLMYGFLYQKFNTPAYKYLLLKTGNSDIIEGNTWNDEFWGVCNGKGSNVLGQLLMSLRDNFNEK